MSFITILVVLSAPRAIGDRNIGSALVRCLRQPGFSGKLNTLESPYVGAQRSGSYALLRANRNEHINSVPTDESIKAEEEREVKEG